MRKDDSDRVKIILVAREPDSTKVDFSLEFELPAVPRQGDYISVSRPDVHEPFGEDFIVRHVWWRLRHSETHGYSTTETPGEFVEVFVECDPATGPYSSQRWRDMLESARTRGCKIEEMQVSRRVLG
jgi:hypothetical protein